MFHVVRELVDILTTGANSEMSDSFPKRRNSLGNKLMRSNHFSHVVIFPLLTVLDALCLVFLNKWIDALSIKSVPRFHIFKN